MKQKRISLVLNFSIFVMVLFSTIGMMVGFEFMGHSPLLATTQLSIFKFFTVDSNLFMGLASFLLWMKERDSLKTRKKIVRRRQPVEISM